MKAVQHPVSIVMRHSLIRQGGKTASSLARTLGAWLSFCSWEGEETDERVVPYHHENDTNFGSLGKPSAPMLFFLKLCSIYTLLASSKPMPRFFMILCTSRFPLTSSPALESPSMTLLLRSKSLDVKPDSTSDMKDVGTRL
jgi:hypothetical protein